MKKVLVLFLIVFALTSCEKQRLSEMGLGLYKHITQNDSVQGINTKVEQLVPLSYTKLDEVQKKEPQDVYLCRIYLKAYWSYEGGMRAFNISDTLDCYYDKDRNFLRTDDLRKEN